MVLCMSEEQERGEGAHAHTGRLCLLLFRRRLCRDLPGAGPLAVSPVRGPGPAGLRPDLPSAPPGEGPPAGLADPVRPGCGTAVDGGVQLAVFQARPGVGRPDLPHDGHGGRLAPGDRLRRVQRPGPGGYGGPGETQRRPLCGRAGGRPAPRGPDRERGPLDPGEPDLLRGGHHLLHGQGHLPSGGGLRPAGRGAPGGLPLAVLAGGALPDAEGGHPGRLPGGGGRRGGRHRHRQPGQPHRPVHQFSGAGGPVPHHRRVRDAPGLPGRPALPPAGQGEAESPSFGQCFSAASPATPPR